ncbi:MAG TPA: bZIP transcription factor [Gemmatimonadales bacterium]|jgi:hypothetical protein|nr:bZIP transcription factor [Gemmatimonadales bacterium]
MIWGILLLAVLLIPISAILMDSPIGRALARRLEGAPDAPPPPMVELAKKVELLEAEVDDLHRAVEQLQEENQFLQKLLEDGGRRPTLPPGAAH